MINKIHIQNTLPNECDGSPSQFGDGGIHFLCSDKSQEQHKIGLIRSWEGGGDGGLSGPMD